MKKFFIIEVLPDVGGLYVSCFNGQREFSSIPRFAIPFTSRKSAREYAELHYSNFNYSIKKVNYFEFL